MVGLELVRLFFEDYSLKKNSWAWACSANSNASQQERLGKLLWADFRLSIRY